MSPIAAYLRALLLLTAIAFTERIIFAVHHSGLSAELPLWQLGTTLLEGLRFDLAVAALLAFAAYLPSYLLHRTLEIPFLTLMRRLIYVAALVLVVVHGADLLYFEEAGRHLGYEIKEAYNSGGELVSAALHTYTRTVVIQLLLLAGAGIAVYFALPSPDPRARRMFAPQKQWYQHIAPEGQFLLALIASVVLVRGGLQSVPLEPLHAQSLGDPNRAALALNGAYNALFSATTPYSIERVVVQNPTEEQKALVSAMYANPGATPTSGGTPPLPNVVMVFLESWSANFMASYGSGMTATPFFDELRNRSFTTRDMLAGGHRTTEGLFASLCSAQNPLGNTVAQSQLQSYRYDCLPKLLKGRGYHTAFFQGTVSGTSGTGPFVQLLGFEQSYGKEHVKDFRLPHNFWGLQDPDLYAFTLQKLDEMPQPFLIGINSNSTHDHLLPPDTPTPFDGTTPEGRYRNVLHFADGALREFINGLTTRYPDAVILLVADHAGPSGEGPIVNRYRIPFLIYAPGRVSPTTLDGVATQRDIAPTLLQVLGLPQAAWFTGRSLLEPHPLSADYYHTGMLGWIDGEIGVQLPVRGPGAAQCFVPRGDFAAVPCGPEAPEAARRGLAFTTVAQDLLFRGQMGDFQAYRGVGR